MTKAKKIKKISIITAISVGFVYILLQFGISFYKMPDQTMENTIKKGEILLVNKVAFGDYFLGFKMPSFSNIERGEVVYFYDPSDVDNPLYRRNKIVGRVVALPNDVFELRTRSVYVNNELIPDAPTVKQGYRLVAKEGVELDTTFFSKYGLTEYVREDSKSDMADKYKEIYQFEIDNPVEVWEVPMTAQIAKEVEKDSLLSYVRMVRSKVPGRYYRIWPYSQYWFWNRWSIRPAFEVPGKGVRVPVNYRTIAGYEEIIEKYEGNKLDATLDNKFYINGQLVNTYTVKENYYIVFSDNRDRFYDTRSWGLVPEKLIIGRVLNVD